MRRQVYLLVSVIALYLVTAYGLHLVYGPSYEFPQHENGWRPDGAGGWVAEGKPTSPMPAVPSRTVPTALQYLPFFLPGLLLVLFLFTPLRRKLDNDRQIEDEPENQSEDQSPPEEPRDTP